MGNLKQRLSAFFPQLTTKEYKFLVEDPSGSTGGCGAASGAVRTCSAARHGGIGAARSSSSGGEAAPIDGSFSGEGGTSGAGGSYTNGTRAGLDVDQLWDLINSFQQLQRSLGGGQVGPTEGHNTPSSGAAPTTAFNTSLDAYLVGSQGNAGARAGEGGFDAVAEAFRIYDPRNSHYVEEDILSCIMARVGFGDLSKEELAVLVSTADFDGDGRISLEDFRHLVCMKGRFKK
ncbi:putative EF-hand domain pair [Leishmania shawi]|uniref:EF-hand domain pair n=1 Tax=Leishmania shawi TaxID=5680 RepID=A0AAW3CE76_9TRYP